MKKNGKGIKIVTFIILLACCTLPDCHEQSWGASNETRKKYIDIILEMNTVTAANLINSLYLTADQAKLLAALAKEAEKEQDRFRKEVDYFYPEALETLKTMRRELTMGRELKSETGEKASTFEKKLQDISRPHKKKMKELAVKTKAVLTANQYLLLREFKPCLRLPRATTDPERVGQAQDSTLFEKILVRIRALPPEDYNSREASYIENIMKLKERHHLEYGKEEKERLRKTLRSTRALKDPDFEVQKKNLATELAHFRQPGRLTDEEALKRIEDYFLEPSLIPLFETCARRSSP
jgi:hypothetical protein